MPLQDHLIDRSSRVRCSISLRGPVRNKQGHAPSIDDTISIFIHLEARVQMQMAWYFVATHAGFFFFGMAHTKQQLQGCQKGSVSTVCYQLWTTNVRTLDRNGTTVTYALVNDLFEY